MVKSWPTIRSWSNTQTICRILPTNCLSVLDHFVGLVLKGLRCIWQGPKYVFIKNNEKSSVFFGNSENNVQN